MVLRFLTAAAGLVALVAALHHVAEVPVNVMSASRVVPALSLARGLPIYAGPENGPIIDFMYGPLAALAFLPAAAAGTPGGALAIAVVLNAAAFFLPMLWLHRRAAMDATAAAAGFVLFALLVLRDPGLLFSALTIHADAPALGLGAVACAVVIASGRTPTAAALAVAAIAAVLAAWTKQTLAPLGPALVACVLVRAGRPAATRLLAWWVVLGIVVSAICLGAFGPSEVLFNTVTLPSRMPWYGEATAGRVASITFVAGLFARLAWLPAAGVVLLLAAEAAGARDPRLRGSPALVLAAVAVALAPAAVVGGAKVGGFVNTFSVSTYFLASALTAGLAAAAGRRSSARVVLALGLAVLATREAMGPAGLAGAATTAARLRAWNDGPQDRAYRAARAHPGEVFLPWTPLATLLAENRLDNNEIGAWNRDLAGVAIPDALWRRFLPPRLAMVAFPPPAGAFTWLPAPTGRLSEFGRESTLPGLEGWTVLAPTTVAPPSERGLQVPPDVVPGSPRS